MSTEKPLKIALVGNPNLGKTTLFNKLCGLKQQTGNYPGITVDKKQGTVKRNGKKIEVIDLPGINSLIPNSKDEELVVKYLFNADAEDFPDKIVLLVSALNIKKNLYLYEQIRDLDLPLVIAVNMVDVAEKRGVFINLEELQKVVDVPVVKIAAKTGEGFDDLLNEVAKPSKIVERPITFLPSDEHELLREYAATDNNIGAYRAFLAIVNDKLIDDPKKDAFVKQHEIKVRKWRTNASILRYKHIKSYLSKVQTIDKSKAVDFTSRLDKVLLHPVGGYFIFFAILFVIFQAIFFLADIPMGWIESSFEFLATWAENGLPKGYFSRLIVEGLIPGIGGVVIFVPQITILFLFFSILEESGYMSRIVYLTDRLMQRFGMSGKSIVPMISGLACAIPAIMAARTIENTRERLITILVVPLLTCAARLPVYILLIALIFPNDDAPGILDSRGLALMGMYLLGVVMTFIVAFALKNIMKPTYKSYLLMEMPEYLRPDIKNVFIQVWTNVKSFIWNAGKIIIATAVILFVLATNGGEEFNNAEEYVTANYTELNEEELGLTLGAYQTEKSYLGMLGKSIEPAVKPLGYDWKIGVGLISSLAAREVFGGTLSIIYAVNADNVMGLRERLRSEKNPETGLPIFGFATCISLLLFYAFALQCMSTVAVTYKETKSLKWTVLQFGYMTALAYISALVACHFNN